MSPYTKILSLHFRILPPLFLKNFRFPHQSVPFFCIFSPQKVVDFGPQLGDLSLDTIAPKPTWKIETITIVFKIFWIVRSWHFVIHAILSTLQEGLCHQICRISESYWIYLYINRSINLTWIAMGLGPIGSPFRGILLLYIVYIKSIGLYTFSYI